MTRPHPLTDRALDILADTLVALVFFADRKWRRWSA